MRLPCTVRDTNCPFVLEYATVADLTNSAEWHALYIQPIIAFIKNNDRYRKI